MGRRACFRIPFYPVTLNQGSGRVSCTVPLLITRFTSPPASQFKPFSHLVVNFLRSVLLSFSIFPIFLRFSSPVRLPYLRKKRKTKKGGPLSPRLLCRASFLACSLLRFALISRGVSSVAIFYTILSLLFGGPLPFHFFNFLTSCYYIPTHVRWCLRLSWL